MHRIRTSIIRAHVSVRRTFHPPSEMAAYRGMLRAAPAVAGLLVIDLGLGVSKQARIIALLAR